MNSVARIGQYYCGLQHRAGFTQTAFLVNMGNWLNMLCLPSKLLKNQIYSVDSDLCYNP